MWPSSLLSDPSPEVEFLALNIEANLDPPPSIPQNPTISPTRSPSDPWLGLGCRNTQSLKPSLSARVLSASPQAFPVAVLPPAPSPQGKRPGRAQGRWVSLIRSPTPMCQVCPLSSSSPSPMTCCMLCFHVWPMRAGGGGSWVGVSSDSQQTASCIFCPDFDRFCA